jgi:hypothetical protein
MRGDVWVDARLRGGQEWWSEILAAIRSCDLFVIALSRASLQSEACMYEANYALSLARPVLPIAVEVVNAGALPEGLRRLQIVAFTESTVETVRQLARALLRQPVPPPLPDPVPDPPPMPRSYGDDYRRRLAAPGMTLDEQVELFAVLRAHCADPINGPDALDLLKQLRERPDIAYRVAQDIDVFIATPQAPSLEPALSPSAPDRVELEAPCESDAAALALWEETLMETLRPFVGPDFFVAPAIPEAKLSRARAEADVPHEESVVALIDCTYFGSAANCVVFTTRGTYHHHNKLAPSNSQMRYSMWPEAGAVGEGLNDIKSPDGRSYYSLAGSAVNADKLISAMNAIAETIGQMPPGI